MNRNGAIATANEKKVAVAVPKKSMALSIGVFTEDGGIVNVEIPRGLRYGDEFELTYQPDDAPQLFKVVTVPLPRGVSPGHVFQHRAPNGKIISVICPPKAKSGDFLLIPWSDSSNPHHLVQARLDDSESSNSDNLDAAIQTARAARSAIAKNAKPQQKPGFSEDDIQLARALSLTTLSAPYQDEEEILRNAIRKSMQETATGKTRSEEEELERAMRESVIEAQRRAQRLHQASLPGNTSEPTNLTAQNDVDRPVHASDEDELQQAIRAGIAEAEQNRIRLQQLNASYSSNYGYSAGVDMNASKSGQTSTQTSTYPSSTPNSQCNTSVSTTTSKINSSRAPDDDEDALLRKVQEASLREAQNSRPKNDDEDEVLRQVLEMSVREAEERAKLLHMKQMFSS